MLFIALIHLFQNKIQLHLKFIPNVTQDGIMVLSPMKIFIYSLKYLRIQIFRCISVIKIDVYIHTNYFNSFNAFISSNFHRHNKHPILSFFVRHMKTIFSFSLLLSAMLDCSHKRFLKMLQLFSLGIVY